MKSEVNGQTINTPAASDGDSRLRLREEEGAVSSHLCGIFSREKMARGKNEREKEKMSSADAFLRA